jgi:hypothetical protein
VTLGVRARWLRQRLALILSVALLPLIACVGEIEGYASFEDGADAGPGAPDSAIAQPDAPLPLPPDAAQAIELPDISFDRYHTQEEIAAYLRAVAEAAPSLTTFEVLGESEQGREIAMLIIDATGEPDPPVIYANGTHHGDEKSATQSTLAIIDHLLRNREDPTIAGILSMYAVYVQPLVNADGHAMDQRGDAYGRDPNRDYLIPGRDEADAFHMVETRLVRDLHERVPIHASMAFHSGVTVILWPWGYTYDATDDHDLFHTLVKPSAEAMGIDSYYQSVELYPAEGEYSDYAYMAHGTLSLTMEVSTAKTPPTSQIEEIVNRSLRGTVAFMDAVRSWDLGELPIEPEMRVHFGIRGPVPIIDGQKLE